MAISNFVNQAFLKKVNTVVFFKNKNKKPIAAFDLKVVDADDLFSLSLFSQMVTQS